MRVRASFLCERGAASREQREKEERTDRESPKRGNPSGVPPKGVSRWGETCLFPWSWVQGRDSKGSDGPRQ